MSWFAIAILAPVLWAIVNHTDKFLLSKLPHKATVGALMMFSTLFSSLVVIGLAIFMPELLKLPMSIASISIIGGVLNATSIYLYLLALDKDEASIVVPFFQLVPVFATVFGFLMLGETISILQISGMVLIILGALSLSIEVSRENHFHFKKGVVFLMLCSSIILAFQDVLFKYKALESSFMMTLFWTHVGLLLFGIILSLSRNNRQEFKKLIASNSATIFGVNVGSELLTALGNAAINLATLLAPIGVVLTIYGYQPLAAFVIGVTFTLFFPKLIEEKIHIGALTQKIIGIVIIFIGTMLL
jgi:drug/metabolite transporter (DMT)-like permease